MDGCPGIVVDGSGRIFVTGGSKASWGWPVRAFTPGAYDAFVAELSPNGSVVWNTFLGGFGHDYGNDIALDGSGNLFVAGYAGNSDAFVAKLSTSGPLQWVTFMGGSGTDYGQAIAVDGAGNAYVVGESPATWGSPVRPHTGDSDGFAAKLNSSGSLVWNTFIGSGATDRATGIAVDSAGNACVAGKSEASWGWPVRSYSGGGDGFVANLNPSGSLVWNTFLGGSGDDWGSEVVLGGTGGAFVSGTTPGSVGTDAFMAMVDAGGSLALTTFIGGANWDQGSGIALDTSGGAYLVSYSWDTWGAPARPFTDWTDGFVAKLVVSAGWPTINKVTSNRATRGSPATIIGTGFSTKKTDNVVYLGGKKADIKRARAKRLNVNIPGKCKKALVDVYVVVTGVKSNTVKFTVK